MDYEIQLCNHPTTTTTTTTMLAFTWISSLLPVPCSQASVCCIGTNAGFGTRQQTQEWMDGTSSFGRSLN